MKTLYFSIATLILALGSSQQTQAQSCSDLFISEVIEGWSNNKAVEIYNPTAEAIDASGYGLVRFTNGSAIPGAVSYLSGAVIQPYDVYVVVLDKRDPNGTGFEAPVWDDLQLQADTFINPVFDNGIHPMYFNGNDAIALVKEGGTVMVDLFGKIADGLNPDGWGAYIDDGGFVQYISSDHTLVRKPSILQGTASNPESFVILNEYDSLPANTFTQLGFHICDCAVITSLGCMNSLACNYEATALEDDGSCVFPGDSCDDFNSFTVNDMYQSDCTCLGEEIILGCTNSLYCNFNPLANVDDNSCLFITGSPCNDNDPSTVNDVIQFDCSCAGVTVILGCTDSLYCNYNPEATVNDGTCEAITGSACDDGSKLTVNDSIQDDCSCLGTLITSEGCTDETACNYDELASIDDGSCSYLVTYEIEGDASTELFTFSTYTYSSTVGSTYDWSVSGGAIESGQGTAEIEVIWALEGLGSVCVQETNEAGCESEDICKNIAVIPTSIEELKKELNIKIYPNPNDGQFNLECKKCVNQLLSLKDITGKIVWSQVINEESTFIDTELSEGIYFLKAGNLILQKISIN